MRAEKYEKLKNIELFLEQGKGKTEEMLMEVNGNKYLAVSRPCSVGEHSDSMTKDYSDWLALHQSADFKPYHISNIVIAERFALPLTREADKLLARLFRHQPRIEVVNEQQLDEFLKNCKVNK